MTAPRTRRANFNDADLRYLRTALAALKDAHIASAMATDLARDPRVRTLARRARTTQADDIRAITSMLLRPTPHKPSPDPAGPETPLSPPGTAAPDLPSHKGVEVDRHFINVRTAHAETSLASARTEMIEGFGEPCRRHAQNASCESRRQLAALNLLAPADSNDQASAPPAPPTAQLNSGVARR
jgi:uncharacterized protein (DUF305 family)